MLFSMVWQNCQHLGFADRVKAESRPACPSKAAKLPKILPCAIAA